MALTNSHAPVVVFSAWISMGTRAAVPVVADHHAVAAIDGTTQGQLLVGGKIPPRNWR